jgi:hypothetical protein
MGVVIEICIKYPGGPTRMGVTDVPCGTAAQYYTDTDFTVAVPCSRALASSAGEPNQAKPPDLGPGRTRDFAP